jgi:hypothetical protein
MKAKIYTRKYSYSFSHSGLFNMVCPTCALAHFLPSSLLSFLPSFLPSAPLVHVWGSLNNGTKLCISALADIAASAASVAASASAFVRLKRIMLSSR